MCKPSCFECQFAEVDNGYPDTLEDPGMPPTSECKNEEVDEELLEKYDPEELAEKCKHFKPILIDKCGCCGQPMNEPRYSWKLWANDFYSGELIPVCSKECQEEETDEYIKEQRKAEEFEKQFK